MSNPQALKIAVIYGSVRTARQGIKAARFIINKVEQRGHEATLIDAMEYKLPLLDKMYKEFEEGTAPNAMTSVAGILNAADGFLVIRA
jgi:NAD(P)H-dependent FMN reductase